MALIDRVLRRAKKNRASPTWLAGGLDYYKISARAAGQLVREAFGPHKRPPRPGYEMDLPDGTFNGHPGHWTVSNWGGQYEIMFHYR